VRKILIGITAANLPDATITKWLSISTTIVGGNIHEDVTSAEKDEMIEVLAAYYSLTSYATFLQTSKGKVPNAVIAQMTELSKVGSVLMSIHSRADGAMAPPALLALPTTSALDDTR